MDHDELIQRYSEDQVAKANRMFEAMFGKVAQEGKTRMLADILEGIAETDPKLVQEFKRRSCRGVRPGDSS